MELVETNRSAISVNEVSKTWDERARKMRKDGVDDRKDDRERWRKIGSSEEDLVGI